MIPRQKSPSSRLGVRSGVPSVAPVPAWLRRAGADAQDRAGQGVVDGALVAGAALGVLDAVVRRQAGRIEDEAALRDTFVLSRPGDLSSPGSAILGPAGSMLLAWRRLAGRPAADLLTETSLAAVLEEFGYASSDGTVGDLADDLRQLATGGMAQALTDAFMAAERHGFASAVGAWFADALLARPLGWTHAMPLLGGEAALVGGAGRRRRPAVATASADAETEACRTERLFAAQARAALRAIDLAAEIGRRADKLVALVPKLRAKGADAVVDKLLYDDAVMASEKIAGMSDRALRRLFDRLIEFGAVRELSGRPTFRIYGL